MPKLAALSGTNSSSKILLPGLLPCPSPPQASVIESPKKSTSTPPRLAISTNLSWRPLSSFFTGVIALCGFPWSAKHFPVNRPTAARTPSVTPSFTRSRMLLSFAVREPLFAGLCPVCATRSDRSSRKKRRAGPVMAPVTGTGAMTGPARRLTRITHRPHRACLGGAEVSAPEGERGAFPAPTELVSVERGLGDKKRTGGEPPRWCRSLRSTGASPVGARRGEQPLLVQKPLLHRGEPGGGGTRRPLLAGAEACAPPGRVRWGRCAIRASLLRGRGARLLVYLGT